MTESEWLNCDDPGRMLDFLRGKASERKLRLFACACCRAVQRLLDHGPSRRAVEVAECYADGAATDRELAEAHAACTGGPGAGWHAHPVAATTAPTADAARAASEAAVVAAMRVYDNWREVQATDPTIDEASVWQATGYEKAREGGRQAALLRCIVGNPSRPVAVVNPAWRTPAVVALARAIYDERAFERVPELADALEAAGCEDAGLLGHCRGLGLHVRACWVVDSLLGQT